MSIRDRALRRASLLATAVLVLTVTATAVALLLAANLDPESEVSGIDLPYLTSQLLCYGVVGAVLMTRRPDLPFGWILSLSALCLTAVVLVSVPAMLAFERGEGSELALWAFGLGSLAWVPTALEGVINSRFPSGRPSGRFGRLLDRTLVWGIAVVVVAGFLSDWPQRELGVQGASRLIDSTPVPRFANVLTVGVPLLILLGIVAGIGVVVRFFRATGLQRRQLQWRAGGVAASLIAFPFVVAEVAPRWVALVAPLVFVATLVIPVLRYDLWAIDSIVRRSAAYTMASPGSAVSNLLRAVGEMLRLPFVAVVRSSGVLASYGESTGTVRSWPLIYQGQQIGELVASPRWGRGDVDVQDAQVLATMAELVGGSVRAEALNADLLEARQRLVSAREEERRRLRRDLHDGLGPLLTGLGLNLDAAAAQLHRDDQKSSMYLSHAKAASTEVISTLRELVNGLRPPALDDLGFAGALRLQAGRVAADAGMALTVESPDPIELPAAVEVAALRTAVEAVTNAARHSGGSSVHVDVQREDRTLVLTVVDDGESHDSWHAGVGLTAMRERADELGATLEAGPTREGGRIRVSYPLASGPS